MDAPNLRHLVREVIATSMLSSPRDIADEVMRRLERDQFAGALQQALPSFVRQVNSEQRMPVRLAHVAAQYDADGNPLPVQQVFIPSAKQAAIRDDWRIRARMFKVPGVDGWKSLLECTRDDLLHAADSREEQGHRNLAKAKQYRALAATLRDHGAPTVGELPEDVLRLAVGEAA